jgi:hypothetical protein
VSNWLAAGGLKPALHRDAVTGTRRKRRRGDRRRAVESGLSEGHGARWQVAAAVPAMLAEDLSINRPKNGIQDELTACNFTTETHERTHFWTPLELDPLRHRRRLLLPRHLISAGRCALSGLQELATDRAVLKRGRILVLASYRRLRLGGGTTDILTT